MLRTVLFLFHNSPRRIQTKIISLLVKEGLLTTNIPLSYFSLEDDQINTPLTIEVEEKGISHLFPRLLFLYDMLPASDESEKYLKSLSQTTLEKVANLSTQSYMVTQARNILNSRELLPDIWQNITKHLPKRETSSLSIASSKTKNVVDEYIHLHQYSIEKENASTIATYYNKFRLTQYQTEMLELLRINLLTKEGIDFYVPDYYNKCVITAVFALELIFKKGWKVGINTNYYRYLIRDLPNHLLDLVQSIVPKEIFKNIAGNIYSDNPEKRIDDRLLFVTNNLLDTSNAVRRRIPIEEIEVDYVINIEDMYDGKGDISIKTAKRDSGFILPSFALSEVYPVLVTTNNFKFDGEESKVLIYNPNTLFESSSIITSKVSKNILTTSRWSQSSIELLEKVNVIVLNAAPENMVDETYTLLSQYVKGPKKLIVNKIPLPFKIINTRHTSSTKPRVELCGLSYKEILTNISNKTKLDTCYLLMDPNQNIEDMPKVYPIKLRKDMFYNYTLPELKEMLKMKGLSVAGKKEDLINRLYENQ